MVDPKPVTTQRQAEPAPEARPPRADGPRRLLSWMLALSLGLHLAFGLLVLARFRLPDLEIEISIPIDVELGMTEPVEVAPPPPPPALEPPPAPSTKAAKSSSGADAGTDAGRADAGQDAGSDAAADGSTHQEAAVAEAGMPDAALPQAAGPGTSGPPTTRIPAGQSVALRVDMARVRASAFVDDVRNIVTALPDWKALLDGADIDAIGQLDLLLIMTPDPRRREPVVIAGRYSGGRELVDRAVQNLASARGVEAHWRNRAGIQVAPWANADVTERVVALAGPAHFIICREQDLDVVLALGAVRGARAKGKKAAQAAGAGMDGLLSVDDGALVSLEVEGAEQYVRRARRGVPQRLALAALAREGGGLDVRGHLIFADETRAADARDFWLEKRDAYAGHPLVSVLGFAPVLKSAELRQNDQDLVLTLQLAPQQVRLALGYVGSALGAQPAPGP